MRRCGVEEGCRVGKEETRKRRSRCRNEEEGAEEET